MAHHLPYTLLRDLPAVYADSRKRLERLIAHETGLPLHKRKFFAGLPGDYLLIDESGVEMWASEWCHKAFVDTCPRGLHKRSRQ